MNCCSNWFRNERERGFTLIEVIAGLALLGSLLAGVTLARARFTRQQAHTEQKLEAIAIAEKLLAQWWQESPDAIPRNAEGTLPGIAGLEAYVWRTRQMTRTTPEQPNVVVVRLELLDQKQSHLESPLVVVDLVVAKEPEIVGDAHHDTQSIGTAEDPTMGETDEP